MLVCCDVGLEMEAVGVPSLLNDETWLKHRTLHTPRFEQSSEQSDT